MAVVLVPMTFCSLFWFFSTCVAIFSVSVHCSSFDELFQPSWAEDHVMYEGEVLKLKLDSSSGAGFASKSKYLYGRTTVQIKLVEGDSAGTVTAFYMASDGTTHNEFDFEFLGNTTGEPYLVQTNVYVNGVGNREQRLSLWFDPTKDFHSYAILWNRRQVVFMVDETPVRLYTNKEKQGVPFPKDQPMGIYSSIWNADDWATQGGRIKTDWSHAPFVSTYRGFEIDACEWLEEGSTGDQNLNKCGGFGWDKPVMARLNVHQRHQLIWVRANHLVYDYCMDNVRFTTPPAECIPRWKRP